MHCKYRFGVWCCYFRSNLIMTFPCRSPSESEPTRARAISQSYGKERWVSCILAVIENFIIFHTATLCWRTLPQKHQLYELFDWLYWTLRSLANHYLCVFAEIEHFISLCTCMSSQSTQWTVPRYLVWMNLELLLIIAGPSVHHLLITAELRHSTRRELWACPNRLFTFSINFTLFHFARMY